MMKIVHNSEASRNYARDLRSEVLCSSRFKKSRFGSRVNYYSTPRHSRTASTTEKQRLLSQLIITPQTLTTHQTVRHLCFAQRKKENSESKEAHLTAFCTCMITISVRVVFWCYRLRKNKCAKFFL